MIIVSDTSPLTNLAAIGQFDLLHRLYSAVNIPDGVWRELNAREKRWPGSDEVAAANWIQHHTVKNKQLVDALMRDLDRGEAETIALALEIGADLIIMDEREGRHMAQRFGLKVIGVIGILLESKKAGHLANIRPFLDALRQTAGFYIKDSLYRSILKFADEQGTPNSQE